MAISLNHTIVASKDAKAGAAWLAEMLGLPAPKTLSPFECVETANGVTLDFITTDKPIAGQHYAFLISEDDFDAIYGRIVDRGLDHWAEPNLDHPGKINHNDGGRGVYFVSPDGHFLEVLTRPYGSGG